MSTILKDP